MKIKRAFALERRKLASIEWSADVTDSSNVSSAGAVMDSDFIANGRMVRTGEGTYTTIKDNLTAIVDPTVNDDALAGYTAESRWINIMSGEAFILVDATAGSALWESITDNIADIVSSAGEVTTPDDAWVFPVVIASILKKITWANIKTGLKTYFDTLYATIAPKYRDITLSLDGGGSAITSPLTRYVTIPYAGTITGWYLTADQIGSIIIDIWKDIAAGHPPTDADSITNGHEPTLNSAAIGNDIDLSDWSEVEIEAGDVIAFNVDSCTAITAVTLTLRVEVQ